MLFLSMWASGHTSGQALASLCKIYSILLVRQFCHAEHMQNNSGHTYNFSRVNLLWIQFWRAFTSTQIQALEWTASAISYTHLEWLATRVATHWQKGMLRKGNGDIFFVRKFRRNLHAYTPIRTVKLGPIPSMNCMKCARIYIYIHIYIHIYII